MVKIKYYPHILTGLAILSACMPIKTTGELLESGFSSEKQQKRELVYCPGELGDPRQDVDYANRRMRQFAGFAYDGGFTSKITDCYWSAKSKQDFDTVNPGRWQSLCEEIRQNSPIVRRLPLNGYLLTEKQKDELFAALRENNSVEYLDLRSAGLGYQDIDLLIDAVKNNVNLKGLDLCGNAVSPENMHKIGAFLTENKSLKTLLLGHWNPHKFPSSEQKFVDREFIRPLVSALPQNNTLKCLGLQGFFMSKEATKDLFGALKKNKSIEVLDLQDAFGDTKQGADSVVDFLASDPPLKQLNLFGDGFKSGTGTRLAKALERNTHLETLYANGNNFNSEDYRAVANMLLKNATLQELYSDGTMQKDVVALFMRNLAQNFSFRGEDFFCDTPLDYNERNALSGELFFNARYQMALKDPKATTIPYVNVNIHSPLKKFVYNHFESVKTYLNRYPERKLSDYLKANVDTAYSPTIKQNGAAR